METLNSPSAIHPAPYTLSELCALIGEALDHALDSSYWVKAEISSLSHKGGHLYLDLIETRNPSALTANPSQIASKMRAACWAGTNELLMAYFESETGQPLQVGMSVLLEVQVQWHAVYGLSLSVLGIDPAYTLGDIARQRQQTIAALQADGLLEAQQLLPLPTLIRNIAVISSPSAAGYEDFCHQLSRSPFSFHLSPFYATMQGEAAPKSIIAALESVSETVGTLSAGEACCLCSVSPQGGPFDAVVIIRGGGASSDLSCFDDYTLCAYCAQFELPVITGIGHTRDVSVLDLVAHEALKTPTAVAEWLIHRMETQTERINDLLVRLRRTAERQILIRRHRVELLEQRLAARNPERIYQMGYSLLTKNGKIIRSVNELYPGDTVTTHLSDGTVHSTVTD